MSVGRDAARDSAGDAARDADAEAELEAALSTLPTLSTCGEQKLWRMERTG